MLYSTADLSPAGSKAEQEWHTLYDMSDNRNNQEPKCRSNQ